MIFMSWFQHEGLRSVMQSALFQQFNFVGEAIYMLLRSYQLTWPRNLSCIVWNKGCMRVTAGCYEVTKCVGFVE